eukprot:6463854-Amphidinium_carterae.3
MWEILVVGLPTREAGAQRLSQVLSDKHGCSLVAGKTEQEKGPTTLLCCNRFLPGHSQREVQVRRPIVVGADVHGGDLELVVRFQPSQYSQHRARCSWSRPPTSEPGHTVLIVARIQNDLLAPLGSPLSCERHNGKQLRDGNARLFHALAFVLQ